MYPLDQHIVDHEILGVTSGGGGGVTGSGTTNYLARWTSSSAIGIGLATDNASDFTITCPDDGNFEGVVLSMTKAVSGDNDPSKFIVTCGNFLTNTGPVLTMTSCTDVDGGTFIFQAGNGVETAADGGSLLFYGGTGYTEGGQVNFIAGDCTNDGGGGSLAFVCGDAAIDPGGLNTGGSGGGITLTTGIGAGGGHGGDMLFTLGDGGAEGASDGGAYSVTAGNSHAGGDGGSITFTAGGDSGESGRGGSVAFYAGSGGSNGSMLFGLTGGNAVSFILGGLTNSRAATFPDYDFTYASQPTVSRSTAQTAANASVAIATAPASDTSYEICANVNVTTSTTHSFTVICAYTDEGNTARTLTLGFTQLSGATLITAITNVTGAGPYESPTYRIRAKASTTITIATTGTFTTVTYNVEGSIRRIQPG